VYYGNTSAPVFGEHRWRLSGDWMARTGCDFEAAISACDTAPNRRRARQILPAYGLQDLSRRKTNNRNRNIFLPRNTHGGHFYMAENRTFLLCVDTCKKDYAKRNLTGEDRGHMVLGKRRLTLREITLKFSFPFFS